MMTVNDKIYDSIVERTVLGLFGMLEASDIRYALLRNYEDYPRFGHDVDLVMHHEDLSKAQRLMTDLAEALGWDAMVSCHHWRKSGRRHHQIEIFRFYNLEPLAYLQVDLFHGYSLSGLVLLSEEELLAGRVSDERGFTRIHPGHENFFRLLQLHRLYAWQPGQAEKIDRYRQRVLDYAKAHGAELSNVLRRFGSADGSDLLANLQQGNISRFNRSMDRLKRRYFLKKFLKEPLSVAATVWDRLRDYRQSYVSDPCGITLKVYISAVGQKPMLWRILDELCAENLLCRWTAKGCPLTAFKTLERGGIVIRFVKSANSADLDLGILQTPREIRDAIIQKLVGHHQALYVRNAVNGKLFGGVQP